MRSTAKRIFVAGVVFLTIVFIGVFLTINTLVHKGIETIGSGITQTDLKVDSVRILLLAGHADMSGLLIGNPTGYSTPYALSCAKIVIDFEPKSVFSDVVIIKQILIEEPEVMYEGSLRGSNIQAIRRNIESFSPAGEGGNEAAQKGAGKRVVIERLRIGDGQIHIGAAPLEGSAATIQLPEIEMRDIGRDTNGASLSDAASVVFDIFSRAVFSTVSASDRFMQEGARILGDAVSKGAARIRDGFRGIMEGKQ